MGDSCIYRKDHGLSKRLAEALAFKPCGSKNFGDVLRDEGVKWECDRRTPIDAAVVKCVEALEVWNTYCGPKTTGTDAALSMTTKALAELEAAVENARGG
jgi:hypothetical protein